MKSAPHFARKKRAAEYIQVYIVGDFNYRNVDWSLMIGNRETNYSFKVIQQNFLKYAILKPFRGE